MKKTGILIILFAFPVWAGSKSKIETVTLKCQASACPDMAGYDGPCGGSWIVENGDVPPVSAVGKLPECECYPTHCKPANGIKATGSFEKDPRDPTFPQIFKVKTKIQK